MSEQTIEFRGRGWAALGFWIAVGLVVSSVVVTRSLEEVRLRDKRIRVKGFAERHITSDVAVWRGSFTARDAVLTNAYARLQDDLAKIHRYLEASGIAPNDVRASAVATRAQYKVTDKGVRLNDIEGFELEQSIEISSPDVALLDRISQESTSLIKEGIQFSSQSPEYFYTRIDALKIELLGEATRNAKQRAEQLAKNSGSEVGVLTSADQGIFQITPVHSTEVSDSGTYDTTTIDKSIKAVVTMEFTIR
jgi:uncharacterized protein